MCNRKGDLFYRTIRVGRKYDITRRLEGFETPKEVTKRSRVGQKALASNGIYENNWLRQKLAECGQHSCGSAACPVCFREFRRWLFAETVHIKNQYSDAYLVTLVYYRDALTSSELYKFNPEKLRNRLRGQLKRVGFKEPVIGGLEIDYHQESGLWLPHFHLLFSGDDLPFKELRRRYFQPVRDSKVRRDAVKRPMHVVKLKDEAKPVSYLLKPYWSRIDEYRSAPGKRSTYKHCLRSKDLRLSLGVMDRIGFTNLLFLYKVRRNGSQLRVNTVNENK